MIITACVERAVTSEPVAHGEFEFSPAAVALTASQYPCVRRVRCYFRDGVARLEGRLPTYHQKQVAQETVRRVPGVRGVDNRIVVGIQKALPDRYANAASSD